MLRYLQQDVNRRAMQYPAILIVRVGTWTPLWWIGPAYCVGLRTYVHRILELMDGKKGVENSNGLQ